MRAKRAVKFFNFNFKFLYSSFQKRTNYLFPVFSRSEYLFPKSASPPPSESNGRPLTANCMQYIFVFDSYCVKIKIRASALGTNWKETVIKTALVKHVCKCLYFCGFITPSLLASACFSTFWSLLFIFLTTCLAKDH